MADFLTTFGTSGGPGDCIVSEANGFRSRDQVLVAPNTAVKANDILGKVTATGYHVPVAPGASDGSQTAVCISLDDKPSVAAPTKLAVLARDAEFNAGEVGPAALTRQQKQTAFGQLAGKGLIASSTIADPTLSRPNP